VTALPEPARGRIPELDGVRGLAILLVLVWHYLICLVAAPPPLFRFLNLTWSGVDLFFVLSGFLIGGILLDHRDAENFFGVFYRRRICRILPLYYAWLLLFVILRPLIGRLSDWVFADPLPLWSYATFTQNFLQAKTGNWGPNWLAVTWSLAIEEQFYLLLPLVIRFTPPRRLPLVLAPFIAAAPIARYLLFDPARSGLASYVLLICKTDALLLGVLGAWLIRQPKGVARISRAAPLLRVLFFSCGGFACLTAYVPETRVTRVMSDSFLAIAYAALILLVLTSARSPLARMSRWWWLRQLGTIAYGTYIIHMAVLGIAFTLARRHWPYLTDGSDLGVVAMALAVTLLLAVASWRWFEKPIVLRGQRRWNYESIR
jgi:peptidoglycan/LPS O-acetylase OafA/YrhL